VLRRERLKKCLLILSCMYPEDILMTFSPSEVERKTYEFLRQELPYFDKYMEKWHVNKRYKDTDSKVSQE